MELAPMVISQVEFDWDWFSGCITRVADKVGVDYTPDSIYLSLVDDEVAAYKVVDGDVIGLLIMSEYTAKYTGDEVLFVDVACIDGVGNLPSLEKALTDMCVDYGYDRLEFASTRKGWLHYLESADFEAVTTFSKRID